MSVKFEDVEGEWIHVKTGAVVRVVAGPTGLHDELRLWHKASGRTTSKMLHYFMYEYRRPEGFRPTAQVAEGE